MKKVTGIGGVFFKCPDPTATKAWYEKHLGIPAGAYGHSFVTDSSQGETSLTTWSLFPSTTEYFGTGPQEFMINYRVADLVALMQALEAEGVTVVGAMETYEYGKFAWILDCDGRKIELWEPIDAPLIEEQQAQ